jgi:hypothetical protein
MILAWLCIATSFAPSVWTSGLELPLWAAAVVAMFGAMLLSGTIELFIAGCELHRRAMRDTAVGAWIAGALVLSGLVFVYWDGYTEGCRAISTAAWKHELNYGPLGVAWEYTRQQIPAGSTIAYANTYFTYPLFGFDLDRRVVYAPSRPGVKTIKDLGRIDRPTTGEAIPSWIVEITTRRSDEQTWLRNLHDSGAQYLFVARHDIVHPDRMTDPPELIWARANPGKFRQLFQNEQASVFEILP